MLCCWFPAENAVCFYDQHRQEISSLFPGSLGLEWNYYAPTAPIFPIWHAPMTTLWHGNTHFHYDDVIMGAIASQITSLTIVYSTIYSDADKRKHQSPTSLAFVRGIHRGPVNSPHKWPVTRKMLPFDDVIMWFWNLAMDSLPTWPVLWTVYVFAAVGSKKQSWDIFVVFQRTSMYFKW